jgi:hypothetical protein
MCPAVDSEMTLDHYFENVYFQFYSKIEEVEFYLQKSIDNHREYAESPLPRNIAHFNIAQFYFSAFINALISTWEISKLTIKLENSILKNEDRNGLVGEKELASDCSKFMGYFKGSKKSDHELFKFLKSSRNACAHDGTMSLNGGTGDTFSFMGDLHRYEYNEKKKCFESATSVSPQQDAISSMLLMATRLIPLFEEKLKKPEINSYPLKELASQFPELGKSIKEKSTTLFVSKFSSYLQG